MRDAVFLSVTFAKLPAVIVLALAFTLNKSNWATLLKTINSNNDSKKAVPIPFF
jgi:hypothetical protein